VGKTIARPRRSAAVQTYLPEVARGLGLTMSHFFKNTKEVALGLRNDPVELLCEADVWPPNLRPEAAGAAPAIRSG
jgi:hypothetical protein